MPFTLAWTDEAIDSFNALKHQADASRQNREKSKKARRGKVEGLFKQLVKCVDLLATNPRHPGLHTHEFHSIPHPREDGRKVFEAYVQNRTPGAYRLFWCYGPDKSQITIIAITPHP